MKIRKMDVAINVVFFLVFIILWMGGYTGWELAKKLFWYWLALGLINGLSRILEAKNGKSKQ